MESKGQSAAFFDLDNTLIDGSSIYYFIRGLSKSGEIKYRDIFRFAWDNYRFRKSREENTSNMAYATKRILDFARGRSFSLISNRCEEIVHEFLPKKLFPQMKERIEEHQSIGHHTWIISASPIEIASVVAKKLGMTGAIATTGEVVNGHYSGNLPDGAMHGINKARAIQSLANANSYDLSKSFAYSDSVNDLPLLVSVGNPFIVNPNKALKVIARKNQWPVLVA
ncbi:MAG: HAD-IB family hydrolase [Actinomycetota bacterium]|nr:HAD-IB family hydrolase [Actinomycetota bacterium]